MSSEVTAVITTHVRPASAREALASVCAETHPALEVIVVDDGGAFEMPAHDVARPVRVLRGNSLGVAGARNLGLSAARGDCGAGSAFGVSVRPRSFQGCRTPDDTSRAVHDLF